MQDRTVGKESNAHPVALDDGGPSRFMQVAAGTDYLDAAYPEQFDGIKERISTPIHCMIASQRHDIKTTIRKD